jgi:hypothetical protein
VWFLHDADCVHAPLNDLHDLLGDRPGCTCASGPKPEGILTEIADSIIRNLHMMHSLIEQTGYTRSVFGVVKLKVDFNEGRPQMHGGNSY